MQYPTYQAIQEATHEQLARWSRFLPSPGNKAVGCPDFETVMQNEGEMMAYILQRFEMQGGWNSTLSKIIGWEN